MIFVDSCCTRYVADQIKKVRPNALFKLDVFPEDTKDHVWLREAGRRGWLVITRDKEIRRRFGERRAIIEGVVGCFIMVYRKPLKKNEIAEMVLSFLEDMEDLFETTPRPFIYTVTKNGDFEKYGLRP